MSVGVSKAKCLKMSTQHSNGHSHITQLIQYQFHSLQRHARTTAFHTSPLRVETARGFLLFFAGERERQKRWHMRDT